MHTRRTPPTAPRTLAVVAFAAKATRLMLVPVAMHRQLFGLHVKDRLVTSGHHVVSVVQWLIGLLVVGTTALIFYVVLGGTAAAVAAVVFGLGLVAALFLYPRRTRLRTPQ